MSEAQLMNDEAARSPTGEILDQSTQTAQPSTTQTETTSTQTQQTDPSKTDGQASSATTTSEEKTEAKPTEPAKAPDAYTAFSAPEGYKLDDKLIAEVTPIFKELGLTQDQAQKLVTLQAQQMIAAAKAPQATYESLRNDWRAKVSADPDIKAYTLDGQSGLDAVKIDIGRALGTLDPTLAKDFREAMDLTGAGDNPAFIKTLWRLSQGLTEGKAVTGKSPSPHGQTDPAKAPRPSAAQALYPTLVSTAR